MSKLDKPIKAKKALTLCIVCALVCSLLTAAYVYASSPATFQVITSGQYPGAPSYTIFVDNGVYYAKNAFGGISWSSTNAPTVFQNVCNALNTTGGTITISAGTYNLGTTGIIIPSTGDMTDAYERYAIRVIGSGQDSTTISYSGTGAAITIGENDNRHFFYKLSDFLLLQSGTAYTGIGILSYAASFDTYSNLRIRSFENSTILDGGYDSVLRTSMYGYATNIEKCHMETCKRGIIIQNRANMPMLQNIIVDSNDASGSVGLYSYGTQSDTIGGNHLYFSHLETGLAIGTREVHISDVWLEDCSIGITLSSNTRGCRITDITATRITTTIVTNNGYRNTVERVHDAVNGLEDQQWGLITSPSNGSYVTYQLLAQPNNIDLDVFSTKAAFAWVSDRNATHFQYRYWTIDGSAISNLWWKAQIIY